MAFVPVEPVRLGIKATGRLQHVSSADEMRFSGQERRRRPHCRQSCGLDQILKCVDLYNKGMKALGETSG